jgi:hypothetical protein
VTYARPYQALLKTKLYALTLPIPVAKSHPDVAPYAGWYADAIVPMTGDTEQVAPVPPPPVKVQDAPPTYPDPPALIVTPVTTWVMVLIVAVQVAWVPPAQRTVPFGARYLPRLLGALIVHLGALV